MIRYNAFVVVFLVYIATSVAEVQAQPKLDLVEMSKLALQQSTFYEKVLTDDYQALSSFLSQNDEELIRSESNGAIKAFIKVPIEAKAGTARAQEIRRRLTSRLEEESRKIEQHVTERKELSPQQIQAWRDVVITYITNLSVSNNGLAIEVRDEKQMPVQPVLRWNRGKYTGRAPKIVSVDVRGWDELSTQALKKSLQNMEVVKELALPPASHAQGKTYASIFIVSDIWGAACYVWRAVPPQDSGELLWLKQKAGAFQRGEIVAVSQGCFPDRIKVAFRPHFNKDNGGEPEFYAVNRTKNGKMVDRPEAWFLLAKDGSRVRPKDLDDEKDGRLKRIKPGEELEIVDTHPDALANAHVDYRVSAIWGRGRGPGGPATDFAAEDFANSSGHTAPAQR